MSTPISDLDPFVNTTIAGGSYIENLQPLYVAEQPSGEPYVSGQAQGQFTTDPAKAVSTSDQPITMDVDVASDKDDGFNYRPYVKPVVLGSIGGMLIAKLANKDIFWGAIIGASVLVFVKVENLTEYLK